MRRVVITGIGIVSSIGDTADEVTHALQNGISGIAFDQSYADLGFRCQVSGRPKINVQDVLDKKTRRFMGEGAAWNYLAMRQAIESAGLEEAEISHPDIGMVMGSGGPSTQTIVEAADITRQKGPKRIGPTAVPKAMSSTNSATLATAFKIKGLNYTLSSACATSIHCIGHAYEQVALGKQDMIFAGGGEELTWSLSNLFDAMGAMSSRYNNDTPSRASRAYDKDRDGFVIAGGAAVLVVEELSRARARGAEIYGEIVGYGANSDGHDMVAPSGEGAVRCMRKALDGIEQPVDYINTHGTSTPIGDIRETEALRDVFGETIPPFSSTKSLTGHSLGAVGAQETVFCLLMMKHDFLTASAHIDELDPAFADLPIIQERVDRAGMNMFLTNSFGFGGTNGCLVVRRFDE